MSDTHRAAYTHDRGLTHISKPQTHSDWFGTIALLMLTLLVYTLEWLFATLPVHLSDGTFFSKYLLADSVDASRFHLKTVFAWIPEYLWPDIVQFVPCPNCGSAGKPDGWTPQQPRRAFLAHGIGYIIGFRQVVVICCVQLPPHMCMRCAMYRWLPSHCPATSLSNTTTHWSLS